MKSATSLGTFLGLPLSLTLALALGCAGVKSQGPDDSAAGSGGNGGGGSSGGSTGMDAAAGGVVEAGDPFDVGPSSVCGNSLIEIPEVCDDGNTTAGDGCDNFCHREDHYTCPMAGKPCVHDVICGDGRVDGNEMCDDGNKADGDGCAADCSKVECGWECAAGTLCRAAKCGDGMVAGKEQCDDANAVDGDGCSALCLLESRPVAEPEGWLCTSPLTNGCKGPTTCAKTTCGDKKKEGSEQCDGTVDADHPCSPFCRLEPVCPVGGGACKTACGDGLLLQIDKDSGQDCDDGDTVDGDGCSSKCKIEPGFKCVDVSTKPDKLVLPVIYHDFQSWKDPMGHVDFQHYQGNGRGVAGIAQAMLGPAGVPVHAAGCATLTANNCAPGGALPTWDPAVDYFGMWYVDNATFNKTIVQTLTLPPIAGGAFQFSSDGTVGFFPIDGMGWGNTPGQNHNFGFTSTARTWFEYTGTANLTFVGDDDVWVYINKKLAVDLGGTHQRGTGSVTLDAANGHGYVCDFVAPGNAYPSPPCSLALANGHDVDLGLKTGSVYEIVVFQAERFTTESNYQLTMSGFTGLKSSCAGDCGDGVQTAPEKCDLGAAKNTGEYGGCKADCTLAPYCGDKMVTAPEECDGTLDCSKICKKIMIQ